MSHSGKYSIFFFETQSQNGVLNPDKFLNAEIGGMLNTMPYTEQFNGEHLENLAFALLTESKDSLSLTDSNFEKAMTIPKSLRPITTWMVAIHDSTCKE